MYYFFGAGTNCCGAIKFWGKEQVIALVDNSSSRIGLTLMGIPIISFDAFIEQYNGEKVIITSNLHAKDIMEQLHKKEIDNIYVCPAMAYGFISSEQMIKRGKLESYKQVYMIQGEPIQEKIYESMDHKENCIFVEDLKVFPDKKDAIAVVTEKGELQSNIKQYCIEDDNENWQRENIQQLEKYRDIYKGEKCVLVGNGPSLSISDLDILQEKGVVCFASNNISKIYDKTKWRPQYHFWGDGVAFEQQKNSLGNDSIYFINSLYRDDGLNKNVEFFYGLFENYYPGFPTFSDDLTKGIYGGRTVTYCMLQVAIYMGFQDIYLIGMDFSWGEDDKKTHFYHDEDEKNDLRVKEAIKNKEEIKHAYIVARNYAEQHDINIYNATRGGYLEIFERVDFDSVFGK